MKWEAPAFRRALSVREPEQLVLGVFPGDPRDIAPGDADVGQFAIAEPVELAKAVVVAAPLLEHANEVSEEHCF